MDQLKYNMLRSSKSENYIDKLDSKEMGLLGEVAFCKSKSLPLFKTYVIEVMADAAFGELEIQKNEGDTITKIKYNSTPVTRLDFYWLNDFLEMENTSDCKDDGTMTTEPWSPNILLKNPFKAHLPKEDISKKSIPNTSGYQVKEGWGFVENEGQPEEFPSFEYLNIEVLIKKLEELAKTREKVLSEEEAAGGTDEVFESEAVPVPPELKGIDDLKTIVVYNLHEERVTEEGSDEDGKSMELLVSLLNIGNIDHAYAHRLGPWMAGGTRPFLVNFVRMTDTRRVLEMRDSLDGTGIELMHKAWQLPNQIRANFQGAFDYELRMDLGIEKRIDGNIMYILKKGKQHAKYCTDGFRTVWEDTGFKRAN